MSFNEVYSKFIYDVWQTDYTSQEYYLGYIASFRKIPLNYLRKIGAIFIPNNNYIFHYLGSTAYKPDYDLYNNEHCLWTHFLIIPIYNFSYEVVGLVGWDVNHKVREQQGEKNLSMYKISNKYVFNKINYFLTDIELLKNSFSTHTLFVVDGVFDSISLNSLGFPCISLLGSMVSTTILFFLNWYQYIYVLSDNDSAGVSLYNKLKLSVPNTFRVLQSKAKDIDDLIKMDKEKVVSQLSNLIANPIKGSVYLKL